jgi:ribonuclease HI
MLEPRKTAQYIEKETMETDARKEITLYTDGACLGNPGPGGWAVIIDHSGKRKELSGGWAGTTNNRMELKAVIEGLKSVTQPSRVHIVTDSRYIHDALVQGWLRRWQSNGWKTASKQAVKNQDLWKELLEQIKKHQVSIEWTRGHQGHMENERCDHLARKAAGQSRLTLDPSN